MRRTAPAKHRRCPKCGHEVIAVAKGVYRCPMNMPFQGCGWQSDGGLTLPSAGSFNGEFDGKE